MRSHTLLVGALALSWAGLTAAGVHNDEDSGYSDRRAVVWINLEAGVSLSAPGLEEPIKGGSEQNGNARLESWDNGFFDANFTLAIDALDANPICNIYGRMQTFGTAASSEVSFRIYNEANYISYCGKYQGITITCVDPIATCQNHTRESVSSSSEGSLSSSFSSTEPPPPSSTSDANLASSSSPSDREQGSDATRKKPGKRGMWGKGKEMKEPAGTRRFWA